MAQLLILLGQLLGGGDEHLPERPRVDEAEHPTLGEVEDYVRVLRVRIPGPSPASQELAAHPQVNDEHVAIVEPEQEVLAPALYAADLVALQLGDEMLLVGM